VVLRFGKPLQVGKDEVLTEGKLHFAWPYPVDKKEIISGGENTVGSTIGWYAPSSSANPQFNESRDGYVLTRDWQILHMQAELRYDVTDPIRYNFEFADVDAVLRSVLDNAITVTAAGYKADEILNGVPRDIRIVGVSNKPQRFQDALDDRVRHVVDAYKLGVSVKSLFLDPLPTLPRGKVHNEYKRLQQTRIKNEKSINDERVSADTQIKKALAEKVIIENRAKAEADRLAEHVENEFAEFNTLWGNYKDDPEGMQGELEARLREAIIGIRSDPNVIKEELSSGSGGARPKAKLVVPRLSPPSPTEGDIGGGSEK
jgi:membrane protease subunit HflK